MRAHVERHGLGRYDAVFEMCDYWKAYEIHVEAMERVTTQKISRKDLRHVAAIRWRLNGADLEQVREWLGLVNLTQVQVYAGIRPRDESDAPIVRSIEAHRNRKKDAM